MSVLDDIKNGAQYVKSAFDHDYLKDLSPSDVRDWYLRLANYTDQHKGSIKESLSSKFLKHYINGGGKDLKFDPPDHLKSSKYVMDVLKYHRAVFLTEKKFDKKWKGVVPRLQEHSYTPDPLIPLLMWVYSNCEFPVDNLGSLSHGDLDLVTSLHGFPLHSWCTVLVRDSSGNMGKKRVIFQWWCAGARDRYDFDGKKHFIVPNPDYKNPFRVPQPVAQDREYITVFHTNALRMENAGLAKPYNLFSDWLVQDPSITGDGLIDPNQQLTYAPWQPATHPPLRWA